MCNSIIIFVGGDVGIAPYALSASLYKMITSCVILRQKLFPVAEVIAVAGEVGQHPADGDRHPDTNLADFPGQQIRQRHARTKRDDRQHDGHARALDGAIEPVEQKQAADAGIKRPLNAQVQNARREYLRLPRLHEDAHERICKDTHERGNDDRKRRAGDRRLPEALFEARFLSCAVVLRREGFFIF